VCWKEGPAGDVEDKGTAREIATSGGLLVLDARSKQILSSASLAEA